MKCLKCGALLSEDSKFCSYCGYKITIVPPPVPPVPPAPPEPDPVVEPDPIPAPEPEIPSEPGAPMNDYYSGLGAAPLYGTAENRPLDADFDIPVKESLSDQIKRKALGIWRGMPLFYRVLTVLATIFGVCLVAALLMHKTAAIVLSVIQLIFVLIAVLVNKGIIKRPAKVEKLPQKVFECLPILLALLLFIPYYGSVTTNYGDAEKISWSDIVLGDILPETSSHTAEIYLNTSNSLVMDVYKTSASAFEAYVAACKEAGFTEDASEQDDYYFSYNSEGYKLCLDYTASKNRMDISLYAPTEYGTLVWPTSGIATLLPTPSSTTGEIYQDDASGFYVFVSNMPTSAFESYVAACKEYGFTVDAYESEKVFRAENEDGYELIISYTGYNVILISVDEPEYDISIKVTCVENWIFSKYDVDVYVDGDYLGTVEHGSVETFDVVLTAGTYKIEFVDAEEESVTGSATIDIHQDENLEYKVSCTSTQIYVETIVGTTTAETAEPVEEETVTEEATAEEETVVEEVVEEETEEAAETEVETETEVEQTEVEETETETVRSYDTPFVNYSTNTEETLYDGNSGVYAYKLSGTNYNQYYIIDFDEGYVYYFMDASYDSTCDKYAIYSGDLNSALIVKWLDGDTTITYKLYFKYKNIPYTMVMADSYGYTYQYSSVSLSSALKIRNTKTIREY